MSKVLAVGLKDEREVSERSDSSPGEVINPGSEESSSVSGPDHVGVWQFDDKQGVWRSFPPAEAEAIFTAYSVGRAELELGKAKGSLRRTEGKSEAMYLKTTTAGTQISTTEKQIRIETCALTEINHTPSYNPVESGVYWENDDGMWHPYENKEHVNTILSTWNTSDYLVFLGKINSDKWPQGASYAYKPKKMHQINIQTGRKRGIRIVPNAVLSDDSSTRLSTRASDCQRLTPISVRSFLVEEAVHKLVSAEYTKLLVGSKAAPFELVAVEFNEHLKGAGRGMLDRFLTTFETMAVKVPDHCGQLLRIIRYAREPDVESVGPARTKALVRHVFLGTRAGDYDAILRSGLKSFPALHKFSAPGFGLQCRDAEPFCLALRDNYNEFEMLVFLAYDVASTPTTGDSRVAAFVPDDVALALPVAKITLARAPIRAVPTAPGWKAAGKLLTVS
ncbi:hypothetical protein MPTK1_3g07240 [Marchantia polymorpha subsp. ruderalis]|uniref:WWE domain-containing protein n=4 Tax=Marchantia polymorpha TaxID=3197 RepID=A0AAF6AYA3_MARPO|nr:hypothetical protein MARPO_0006s0198 [Marchantia polymorpha]BBN04737.1 hypothetical protein Mp_3g07240 [Marchantia polymorpha subsp. ruderalis]|eukprot:PTQ48184.1 hypothetical protein MARPO_0006s0198 [Marchantia polymorpha]